MEKMMDAAVIVLPVTIAVLSLIWNIWFSRKTLSLTERRDFVTELRERVAFLEKALEEATGRLTICERENAVKNEYIIRLLVELRGST